jgi:hypothetical protein
MKDILEVVFSVQSMPRLYSKDKWNGWHDNADILVLKLRCNKHSAYIERQTLPLLKRRLSLMIRGRGGEIITC